MKSDEFIREVDEELQQERLAVLWRRYGSLVVVAAVLIVVGTAGYVGWDAWTANQRASESRSFAAAENLATSGNHQEAVEAFLALADNAGAGMSTLARMHAAAAAAEGGQNGEAVAILESVATDENADPMLRDAALLAKVTREFEQASPSTIVAELEPLTESGSAWRLLARELTALALVRDGDVPQAREILTSIKDDAAATTGQRERADELFRALGGEAESAS